MFVVPQPLKLFAGLKKPCEAEPLTADSHCRSRTFQALACPATFAARALAPGLSSDWRHSCHIANSSEEPRRERDLIGFLLPKITAEPEAAFCFPEVQSFQWPLLEPVLGRWDKL